MAEPSQIINDLKQVVVAVLSKFAEITKELAEAKAAPPAEPSEIAAANERAAAAEAQVKQLQNTIEQMTAEDAAEETGLKEVLAQLSAAVE